MPTEEERKGFIEELSDIFTYMLIIANVLEIDLEAEYYRNIEDKLKAKYDVLPRVENTETV